MFGKQKHGRKNFSATGEYVKCLLLLKVTKPHFAKLRGNLRRKIMKLR